MPAKKRKPQETADNKETVKTSPAKKSKKATETDAISFKLIVEYWYETVFKRRAETVVADLRQTFGEVEVEFNPSKPRRGSFEFTLVKEGKATLIWTGVKKGPPRKNKFPETPDLIIEEIKKNL
ncbi:selenoprotein H-like [Mytilus trossulus]|uniref:selenoprotein H-like n=1 Tax=Mytilus trossulus TaxID=6551 RepID=UPI0030076974